VSVTTPGQGRDGVDELGELVCSARGCSQPATTDLRWNNVKIHTPERRKHWLACDEHTDSLSRFLSARSMLREVVPLGSDAN